MCAPKRRRQLLPPRGHRRPVRRYGARGEISTRERSVRRANEAKTVCPPKARVVQGVSDRLAVHSLTTRTSGVAEGVPASAPAPALLVAVLALASYGSYAAVTILRHGPESFALVAPEWL